MLSGDKKSLKIIDFGLSERIRPPGAQYKRHVGVCGGVAEGCCPAAAWIPMSSVVSRLNHKNFSFVDGALHGGRAVDER